MKKISLFRLENFVFGLLLIVIGSWAGVSYAQVIPVEVQKLLPVDEMEGENFGYSVAMSDDTIVVTTRWDLEGGESAGAAYVFEKMNNGWNQVAKLTASDGVDDHSRGTSVAMSGDTIVLGIFRNPDFSSGAAYIFEKPQGGWSNMTETAILTASDEENVILFGNSVAISGNTVVVGARLTNSAYVFQKPANGWVTMNETAKLTYGNDENTRFVRTSVAISGDTIVIGDPNNSAGHGTAYVFEKPAEGWTDMNETAQFTSSGSANGDGFGDTISIFEDTVVVSASGENSNRGSVYVYEKPTEGWMDMTETAKLIASDGQENDSFGQYGGVTIGENMIAVGVVGNGSYKGSVYIFEPPALGWSNMTETAKLTARNGLDGDSFGFNIAIRNDTIVIGAIGNENARGAAYVFHIDEPSFVPFWELLDR